MRGVTLDGALEHRLKRLMLFRVVMVTTLLLVAVYVEAVSETLLRVNPLYFLIAATYGLTLLHVFALRYIGNALALVLSQVMGDLLIITGLVHLTGGGPIRAGFLVLYPISVLSGSVLLRRGQGLVLAALATALYAALLASLRAGLLAPQGPPPHEVLFIPLKHILYSIFLTGVACGTVALIGGYFSENLATVGLRLEEAIVKVADLQELNTVIVKSLQSGIITSDAKGRLLHVNEIGENILGRKAAQIRGQTLRQVFSSWLLDVPALQARSEQGQARFDVTYPHPDGRAADLGISVSPLATSGPAKGGHLLVFRDLTDSKTLEREMRIKEKLAAVGEMAAQLAHEIRNPLGSISGSAQVLMVEPHISEEQERLLGIITRESKRLSNILNRFLFQARPSLEARGPVDLGPVISEAVTLLKNGPEVTQDHTVELETDGGPHLCLADRDQLSQVFWNLARNALEAMPQGGTLRIRLAKRGADLVLCIEDEGRGMAREAQQRLFEPFSSGTRMGTGLGLAIVYRIVRDHRGDISVRSHPGRGTEVEVRLPLVGAAISASTPAASGVSSLVE